MPTNPSPDKATPRPWRVYPTNTDGNGYCVAKDGGPAGQIYGTAITGWGCVTQTKANAELIVKAVNSYDQLVSENERLREALRSAVNYEFGWLTKARAALEE